jgi:hypothetical protein
MEDPVVITERIQAFNGHRYYRNPRTGGFVNTRRHEQLHRAVWAAAHGPIPEGFVVHHINHDRSDNRLVNLQAMPAGEHASHHHRGATRPPRPYVDPYERAAFVDEVMRALP